MKAMRGLFPLLYWLGILLALAGVFFRFWWQAPRLGLSLAVAGVALAIATRVAVALRRAWAPGTGGKPRQRP